MAEGLGGLRCDAEEVADLVVVQTMTDQPEDFSFATGEQFVEGERIGLPTFFFADQTWRVVAPTRRDGLDRRAQRVYCAIVFIDVGVEADVFDAIERVPLACAGEDHGFYFRTETPSDFRDLEAVVLRQIQIEDQQIGLRGADQIDGLLAMTSEADDLMAKVFSTQLGDGIAGKILVLGDDDPQRRKVRRSRLIGGKCRGSGER